MPSIVFSPRYVDPRRWLLAALLAFVGLALLLGGIALVRVGGSIYYVVAGIALVFIAYMIARGDARGRYLYAGLILGTLIWALCESGLDPWGLQARLLAPVVFGLWVFWPALRRWPRTLASAGILAMLALVWLMSGRADPVLRPSVAPAETLASERGDWPHYGNDLGGTRYSPLAQITPENVSSLTEAWRTRLGDKIPLTAFEATPLMAKGLLYLCTPGSVIFALDAESGVRRWTFDPKARVPPIATCRGVAYYAVPQASGPCAERVIFATADARLMAVDALDGTLCRDFGNGGSVDQTHGLGPVKNGYWRTSSAPAVVRGKVIVGGWVTDDQYVGEPSGVIRAYDAVTGRLAWAWDMDHPDRHGEPPPGETYSPGTPNSWAPMSGDETLGLVYLPMGNSTPDAWGAHRSPASEKYSSSVVALDVETGEVRWSFQITHHDVWDYDVASQPTLVDLPVQGSVVPALIQPTKRGQIFLLDRRNGTPLSQVEEKPAPQGPAPGDFLSPTQPFSTGMPAFGNEILSEREMWGLTPLDQLWCRVKFKGARYDGPLTPPGLRATITYPGYAGGMNWGGVSVDLKRRLMVVNWNRVPNYERLLPRAEADAMGVAVSENGATQTAFGRPAPQMGTPFAVSEVFFMSPIFVPCIEPPFGNLAVVDLDQRKIRWQSPLGSSVDTGPLGMASRLPLPMGVPGVGGAVTTKSGLIFIAAAMDREIRAIDIRDGRKLWRRPLPETGFATPMSFTGPRSGRQFVVIAAGGNGSRASSGEYVIAYALPINSGAKP